ncbi:MAG: divergent polysaccharide deacetylase family protein, partial [Moorella sp. (in: Bacteria)]|nr:divergent polysaccharide deacetylase family protein [Moorella sp. (in: firmicutes)]
MEKQQQKLASQTAIIDWPANEGIETVQQQGGQTPSPPEGAGQPEELQPETAEPVLPQHAEVPADLPAARILESGLAEAPIEGLYETTPDGRLPIIRTKDGLTPFNAYRRPFDVYAANKPVISIAVTGLGLSDVAMESALRSMPPEVSFILSPYAPSATFWVNEARARGHEVWLTLPVEPKDYPTDDPGPHTLLIGAPE